MHTSLPQGPMFLVIVLPDGSRQVIEIDSWSLTMTRDLDAFSRYGYRYEFPGATRINVEGIVGREVVYTPDAPPDFTPTPRPELDAPRRAITEG